MAIVNERQDYTATSLARRAGVSPSYIARLCRQGVIPAQKLSATTWLILQEDAEAWLQQRHAPPADCEE